MKLLSGYNICCYVKRKINKFLNFQSLINKNNTNVFSTDKY